MKKFYCLLCIVSCIAIKPAAAQQAPSASGSEATGSGGTLSYTVGQVDYISLSSPTGILSLGVQQAYQVIANEKNFQILVFPNPTPTAITIRILNPMTDDMQIQLYDLLGRELLDQNISVGETTISMLSYRPATYILKVRMDQEIRTYKIIKTNNP